MNDFIFFGILIFSIIIHEVAHGLVALWYGDDTAEKMGRITLNPIPHIDILGSIVLPLLLVLTHAPILLGWAKPVPINPNNFSNKRWGELWVSLAGPLSNIILIIIFALPLWLNLNLDLSTQKILFTGVSINLVLAIFNLFPIPPLDGSKILYSLLPDKYSYKVKIFMEKNQFIFFIAFILIITETEFFNNILLWILKLLNI